MSFTMKGVTAGYSLRGRVKRCGRMEKQAHPPRHCHGSEVAAGNRDHQVLIVVIQRSDRVTSQLIHGSPVGLGRVVLVASFEPVRVIETPPSSATLGRLRSPSLTVRSSKTTISSAPESAGFRIKYPIRSGLLSLSKSAKALFSLHRLPLRSGYYVCTNVICYGPRRVRLDPIHDCASRTVRGAKD